MSANARIPIDLCDTKISLIEALRVLQEFKEEVKQKYFQDDKRKTIYVAHLVWLMFNGYIPREHEWTELLGVKTLGGWTAGMLYNSSRSFVRDGQPEYPNELDYCNVQGHDLENSSEAWSATKGVLKTTSVHYPKMAEIISVVIHKYFKMDVFPARDQGPHIPARDQGPFGELIRFDNMHKGFQIPIVSAQEQLTAALGIADEIIPKDLDQIRNHEMVMRRLVELDERR